MSDRMPALISEHVRTRRLRGDRPVPADGDALAPVLADEELGAWLWPGELGGARTREQSRALVLADVRHWERHGFGPWIVRPHDGDEVIGRVGLAHARVEGREGVEVAWLLAPAHWGRGLASEMAAAAVAAAFDELGLEEVVSFTLPDNLASQGVMRRLGFSFEREIEHAGLPHVLHRRKKGSGPFLRR